MNSSLTKTAPFSSVRSICFAQFLPAVGNMLSSRVLVSLLRLFSSRVLGSLSLAVFFSFHFLLIDGYPCGDSLSALPIQILVSRGTSAGTHIFTSSSVHLFQLSTNELSTWSRAPSLLVVICHLTRPASSSCSVVFHPLSVRLRCLSRSSLEQGYLVLYSF